MFAHTLMHAYTHFSHIYARVHALHTPAHLPTRLPLSLCLALSLHSATRMHAGTHGRIPAHMHGGAGSIGFVMDDVLSSLHDDHLREPPHKAMPLLQADQYNSCAVVGPSALLRGSRFGADIDNHTKVPARDNPLTRTHARTHA